MDAIIIDAKAKRIYSTTTVYAIIKEAVSYYERNSDYEKGPHNDIMDYKIITDIGDLKTIDGVVHLIP